MADQPPMQAVNIPQNEPRNVSAATPSLAPPKPQEIPKSPRAETSLDNKILWITAKIWWFVYLGVLGIMMMFILGALGTPNWVKQGDGDEWIGAVLSVSSSDFKGLDEDTYINLQADDDICDNDLLDGLCDTITSLHAAGAAYVFFSLIVILSLIGWIGRIVLEIIRKPMGPEWLIYVFAIFTFLCHFLAFVIWAGVSKAKMSGSCDDISVIDQEDVCGSDGPALAVFTILILAFITPLFIFVWWKKDDDSPDSDSPKKKEGLEPVNIASPKKDDPIRAAGPPPAQPGHYVPGAIPPPAQPGPYNPGAIPPPQNYPVGPPPPAPQSDATVPMAPINAPSNKDQDKKSNSSSSNSSRD